MNLRLSRDEIKDLTGQSWRAKQLEALKAMGIPYVEDDEGWPVVSRQAALAKLDAPADKEDKATINPEFLKNLYG